MPLPDETNTSRGPRVDDLRFAHVGVAHVTLCFFPYAAVPVGAHTNIPLSTITAFIIVVRGLDRLPRHGLWLFLGVIPAASVCGNFFLQTAYLADVQDVAVWPFLILPLPAAVILARSMDLVRLRRVLVSCVLAACLYGIVQNYLLNHGRLLDIATYTLPGYSSLSTTGDELQFERRPFGWFPEPSFYAGTIALGIICILLIERKWRIESSRVATFVGAVACVSIYQSKSGSALLSIPAIVFMVAYGRKSARALAVGLAPFLGALALAVAQRLIYSRTVSGATSWQDRAASISAALRFQGQSTSALIVGLGPGHSAELYSARAIPVSAMQAHNYPSGVISILGAVVVDDGLLFGLAGLVILAAYILKSLVHLVGQTTAILLFLTWFFLGTLVLAYNTTDLVWTFAGMAIGLAGDSPRELAQKLVPGSKSLSHNPLRRDQPDERL